VCKRGNRLGLKRTVNGTRELIQVLYEVDSSPLFLPDPLEAHDEDEDSQSQAPRRKLLPLLSLTNRELMSSERETRSTATYRFWD